MSEFNSSLLREKFTLQDAMPADFGEDEPIVALSNRLRVPLISGNGEHTENFVVRAQNMHTAARVGAHIAKSFHDYGPLMSRKEGFNWDEIYQAVTKGYEVKWNPNLWICVYHAGRIVYEAGPGQRHTFLDVIEQCDARNKGDYEKSMEIAKDAFKSAGKLINIKHDANVALVMSVKSEEGKCGIILRGPNRTTTFNFTARKTRGRDVKASQCLTVSAAFLEGIQLAFMIGMAKQKQRYELISAGSSEAQQADEAAHRIARLNSAIDQFESLFSVNYRPDRPNFAAMIDDAEDFAKKVLADEIENKIATGELDADDWIV